jgi:hypothetical protein
MREIARGLSGEIRWSQSRKSTGPHQRKSRNTTASGATSGPEAGFANLFAQADDSPRALPVRGERDPVEAMITHTLLAQRLTATLYAAR